MQSSCSAVSHSLRPYGLQHGRFLCSSPTPRACKLMSIESVLPSNHLILCCPLLLLPSIFPSMRGFSNELALHIGWPKYWSFSFTPLLDSSFKREVNGNPILWTEESVRLQSVVLQRVGHDMAYQLDSSSHIPCMHISLEERTTFSSVQLLSRVRLFATP